MKEEEADDANEGWTSQGYLVCLMVPLIKCNMAAISLMGTFIRWGKANKLF